MISRFDAAPDLVLEQGINVALARSVPSSPQTHPRRRSLVGASLLLAAVCSIPAHGQSGVAAPVEVRQALANNVFNIEGSFLLPPAITEPQAWSVITDYGHYKDFISIIRKSEIRDRRADGATVEQKMVGRWWVFSRTGSVVLDVTESPQRSIAFREVSRKDFDLYEGSWSLSRAHGAVRVEYKLRTNPGGVFPVFVIEKVFNEDTPSSRRSERKSTAARPTV